jgi:hypothetical protein
MKPEFLDKSNAISYRRIANPTANSHLLPHAGQTIEALDDFF